MSRRRLVRATWALSLLLAACSKAPLGDAPGFDASVPCEDRDHDGFGRGCERGYDCDDDDPRATTECRTCSRPERGCECSPGEGPVSCFLEDKPLDEGDVLCSEGTRHCRDGAWSACEDVHQYVASKSPDTQRVIDMGAGKLPCSLCDIKCFQIVDNLLSDGGVAGGSVTFGPGGGITLLPGDGGPAGGGGDAGGSGLTGCAAMMACCSTLADSLKTSCELIAMAANDANCTRDLPAFCPSGTISGPISGGCTLGTGADTDCDGIPNVVDSFPGSPITTTTNQAIFHQLDIGETGANTMNISFKLRNADVYFLLDMTNTMKEERDNLITSLTSTNVINCAHLNQCCNRLTDAAMKSSCQAAVKLYTNRPGRADDQNACLTEQSTYCPNNRPVDCPDGDGNGLPDNYLKTQGVVGATKCLVGSSWFGAGFSREMPITSDPIGCTSGNCSKQYADRDEQLFKNVIDLTPDYNKVAAALQSMTTDGNWDEPEGGMMALHSVITGKGHYFGINRPSIAPRVAATSCPPNSFGYPCFRKDAVPIVVFFTDRPHHNGPPESTNCAGEGSGCPYDQLGKNTSTWTSGASESASDKVARFIPLSSETFSTAYNAGDVRGQYLTLVGDTRFMAGDYPTAIVGCGAAPDAPDALIRFRVGTPAGATGTVPPIPINFHLTKDDVYASSLYGTWRDDRANDPTPATEFGAVISVFRGVPNSVSSTIDLGDRQAYAIASGPDSTYLTYTGTTMGSNSGPGFLGGISDCAADGLTNQVLFTFRPTANARIIVDASESAFPAVVSLHSGLPSGLPRNPSSSDGSSEAIGNVNDTFATANAVPSGATSIDGAYVERTGDSNVAAIKADYTAPISRGLKAVRTNNSNMLTEVSSTAGLQVGMQLSSAEDWSATPVRVESVGTDTVRLSAKWLEATDPSPTSVYFVDSLVGCGVDPAGRDTVFKFNVATPRRVRIDTEGSTYDTVISLHDAPPPTYVSKDDVGGNATAPGYSIGDVYNTSYTLEDKGSGTSVLANNYDYGQCGADKSANDAVLRFTLSKPTHVAMEVESGSWNPIVGLFSSPPGAAVVKDNSANTNDKLAGVFDLGDIYGAVDTKVENSDLLTMSDDWQTSVVGCDATSPSKDQIFKFTPLESTRARITARSVGTAWNPIVAVFDDPPPSSSVITSASAFDATTVALPDTNCLAYSFHDPALAAPAHTYAVCPTKRYATDANTACTNAGMNYLVSINSAAEQAFLMKTSVPTYTGGVFHMGAVDPEGDGIFAWRDGSALSYTNWLTGEPNGVSLNNKCADINATGTWVDGKCTSALTTDSMYYVCEDAAPAVLPNEDAATAYVVPPATTRVITGNTRRMSSDYNGAVLLSSCGGTISGGDAVFSITTDSSTSYPLVVDSAGSSYGVVLGLFEGAIDDSSYLACDAPAGGTLTYMLLPSRTYYLLVKGTAATPDGQYKLKFSNGSASVETGAKLACGRANSGVPASVEVDVDANHTYYVVVDHADALLGKYDLDVHSLYRARSEVANAEAANETGSDALALPDPYRSRITVVDTSTAGMTADYGNGASAMCTTSPSAPDAVYKFTPSLTTNVTFTVTPQGTGLGSVGIGVFDGPPGTSAVLHDLTALGNPNESSTSAQLVNLTGPAQVYQGDTSAMTADVDPSVLACGARANGHDAVFSFSLAKQTNVEIDASSSGVSDPVINLLRSGPLAKPAQVTLENDTKQNADSSPSPTPNATASWLYYGADFTHLSAESQVPVSLAAVNDDAPPGTLQPQDLGDISGKRFVISGGDTGPMLADYPGGWSCGGNDAAPDALYRFFSATGGTVHVKATPQSGFDGVIGLYDGNNGAPLRLNEIGSLTEDTACVPPTGPKNLTNNTLKTINSLVAAAPNINLNCGNTTVITDDPDGTGPQVVSYGATGWCGTQPTIILQQQTDGPELVIFVTKSLQVAAGSTLRVLGSRPVVFVVSGTANIAGEINASPDVTNYPGVSGAGGDFGCALSYGRNATSSGINSGGGGGGGFATAGGQGGYGSSSGVAGGEGGATRANTTLLPLVGGCGGGDGAVGTSGGLAAGAVQISATTSIVLAAGTGSIVADGGNGVSGVSGESGGSGAGSGGAIMLQSPTITYVASQLSARGGSGGQGLGSPATSGGTGAATSAAPGAAGQNSDTSAGGGGGGGGYGRVIVTGSTAVSLAPCTVATNESASSAWPIQLDGSGREYIEKGSTSTMTSNHGGMCGTPASAPDAVYAFTLSKTSTVQIDARSSAAGTVVGLYNASSLGQSPAPTPLANDDRAAADQFPAPTPDATSNWLAYSGDFVNLAPNAQPQTSVDNTGNANEIIPTELPDPIDRRVTVLNANTSAMTADYLAASCSMPAADGARDAIYRFVPSKSGPVRVSANYSQTLFNPVLALYRGDHEVIDELHTLTSFNEATLVNRNVDLSTVKVRNAALTTLYTSADYTVVSRDATSPVVIKRTNTSAIASGAVVSVSYTYDSGAPLPVSQQALTQIATGNTNENATNAVQVPIQSGRQYLYTGNTSTMSADVDGALWSCGPPEVGSRDATFDFSLDKTTAVSISTEGSDFNTTIALFSAPYTRPSTTLLQSPAPYLTQLYDVQRIPGSPEPSCSPFDYSGSRFWICSTARPWGQAEGMCNAVGLHLATIDNAGENNTLLAQIQPTSQSHHIGFTENVHYTDSWGVWTSGGGGTTGSPVAGRFVRWAANEPNGSGDCLQLLTDGTWDDADCAIAKAYVCERNDATPVTPPSTSCGTVLSYGGHSYYACTDKQDWAAANTRCTSANMRLARIEDQPEDDQLRVLLAGNAGWIGGSDTTNEGIWLWTDSAGFWEVTAYRNWVAGEPNEPTTNPGSRMLYDSGQWVDTPATTGAFPYICEDPSIPSSQPTPPTETSPEIVDVFSARRQFTGSTQGVASSVGYSIPTVGCVSAGAAADAVFSVQLDYRSTLSVDITGSYTGSLVALYKDIATAQGYADAGSRCGLGSSAGPQLTATLDPGQYFVVITGTAAATSGVYNVTFSAQTTDAGAFSMRNDSADAAHNNPLGSLDGKWLVKTTDMSGLTPTIGAITPLDMGTGQDVNDVNAQSLGSIDQNQIVITNASTADLTANYPSGSKCAAPADGPDALYSFTVPDSDPIQVRFTPSGWSGQVVVYDGLPLTSSAAPNPDISLAPANTNETPVSARSTPIAKAQAYLGNLTTMVSDVPGAAFNQSYNNRSGAPLTCNADATGSDAFFKFTVSGAPQDVEISSAGSAVAHTIALWDDKPFSKPSSSTLEYASRTVALANPLGGADIDDTWVVATGDMSRLTPYNGYTTITENVDYTRDDTVHDLGDVNEKEIITVGASTSGLAGDYLATTMQCGGASATSPDAIFSFRHSAGGKVKLSLNNPTPAFAPKLAVFREAPPQKASVINPPKISTTNTNEATTSAFSANPVGAALIYTGNTAAMANNLAGSTFTQGSAYGGKVCSADSGATGRDAFVKFEVPVGADKNIEISSLNASFNQTIALFDSTPLVQPTMAEAMTHDTRAAAYTGTIGAIDNGWFYKTATMSSLMPDALPAQPLNGSSSPAVSNTDEVIDLGSSVVGKRTTLSANTSGLAADYTASTGGAVSCATTDSAPDIIYKIRPTTSTKIRAAVNNPTTPTGTAIAILNGSAGHPKRMVDTTPAALSTTACSAAFNYTPSNFTLAGISNFASGANVTLSCGLTLTYNTDSDSWSNLCGMAAKPPRFLLSPGSGGADLAVLVFKSLQLNNGTNITVTGSRGVVFAVEGNATISGAIRANANASTVQGGGNSYCSTGGASGGNYDYWSFLLLSETSGAGGGSFGTAGGYGGDGGSNVTPGAPGNTRGNVTVTAANPVSPLMSGCNGGIGRGCSSTAGGAGGGVIQISAGGSLTVNSTAVLQANGGTPSCGGSGGGSGGAILLEGNTVTKVAGSTIDARGGNGAGDGFASGGSGATASSAATNGTSAFGESGGGGGYGRIFTRVATCKPTNEAAASATSVPIGLTQSFTGSSSLMTSDLDGTTANWGSCAQDTTGADAFWKFTLTRTTNVEIKSAGSTYNHTLALFNGNTTAITGPRQCADGASGATGATITASLAAGTYYVGIKTRGGSPGTYTVAIRDTLAGATTATSIDCSVNGYVDADLTANTDYYLIVKGSAGGSPSYNLVITDLGGVQQNTCGDPSTADAYFDFSLNSTRNVTISLNETGTTLNGSFVLMKDVDNVPSTISTDTVMGSGCYGSSNTYNGLTAGRYYVIVRGASLTGQTLPAEIFIKDESGANALDCAQVDSGGTGTIQATLPTGTYYVGITTRNGGVGNNYELQIKDRDVAVDPGGTWVDCADSNLNLTVDIPPSDGAVSYYAVVKGDTAASGGYTLTVTDLSSVEDTCAAGDSIQMDATAPNAYYAFNVTDADGGGRDVTVSLASTSALDGAYRLFRVDSPTVRTPVEGCFDKTAPHTYADLVPGNYYLALRGKNVASGLANLTYELSVNDQDAYGSLTCADGVATTGTTITRTLNPGDYWVGIKPQPGQTDPKNYSLRFRDTAVVEPVNSTEVACGTGIVNASVTAGKTYYVMVKGSTAAAKGPYGLAVTDLGGSAGWGCNDDSGAGDAYFEFNVDDPNGRRVTIDTDKSMLDTVLAVFPLGATIGAAGKLACDDNNGSTTKASKVTLDLDPGVYYAVVRPALGAPDPNLPFEISFRDESVYSSIACGATTASGKAQIRTTLGPGTYHTVLKGTAGSSAGAYKIRFRDETPYLNAASEEACNDAENELVHTVVAGKPYYAVVKGAEVSESGPYRLTVENVVARNGMGCNANPSSPDAVYRFHLSADTQVQIDTLNSQTSGGVPTDTVMALYDASASYFGVNYALDKNNVPVNCDDNSGNLAKGWSQITADLAGNRDYYVVVQSKNSGWGGTTTLPFVVNVKDVGTNQPIACASASSSLLMTEPLPAGDYRVVVSNTGAGAPFDLRFKNVTAASSGATQVACADTPEEFTYNVVAGRPYYLMVKGDSANDRGQYGLVVETSGTGANSMGCGANPSAPDAFFKFQLASQATVTIDTEGSAADTVIALYPGSTNVFGTNYALDVNGVEISCDDDGGVSAGASLIQRELAAGSYYVVVKGKTLGWNEASQPFNLSIRDQSNTGSIACASDTEGSKRILETLPAGDYQVVMSTRSAAGGAYSLKLRDTAVSGAENGARVACVAGGSLTVNNLAGGHEYYLVVKGNNATDSGGYNLTMEDTVSLAAASGSTSVACAAEGMTIDGTYPAGTYYALVTGRNASDGGRYTLKVRDVEAVDDQNRLACDDNGGPNLTSVIERDLNPGTHYVVVKGNGDEARGAYRLHVRDTQAVPDRELACAGAEEAQRVQADVKAGQDYTVVLKGDASSASGAYDIKLYDQLGLQTGTGQNLKCLADPMPTTLVKSDWHTRAVDFDLSLTPDTYYVAVKGQKSTNKGTFQLNIGEKSARTTTTYTPPTWTEIQDALATSSARVLPVIATGGEKLKSGTAADEPPNYDSKYITAAESQAKTIAITSGAKKKDGSAIWQRIQKDGTGTGSGLITGIAEIADYLAMDVSLVAVDGPDPGASKFRINISPGNTTSCQHPHPLVDTSTGVCTPRPGNPAGYSCNTQYQCTPGSAPKFSVTFTNPSDSPVPPNTNDPYGGYHFKLQIIGDKKYLLDEVPVYIIPTSHAPMGPPAGDGMFKANGVYTQDILTAECPKLSSATGATVTNDLPQWSDLYFNAGLPEGTSIDFELCTKEKKDDLSSCVWSNGTSSTRKKVTVRSKGTCASDAQCRNVPDYGNGFCASGACQFISEPKVTWDIACADNTVCPNGPYGAGEYLIGSRCELTRGAFGYGHCVYTTQPADLGATLLTGEQGLPYARIRFTLHADTAATVAPTLYQWNLTYSCKSAQ